MAVSPIAARTPGAAAIVADHQPGGGRALEDTRAAVAAVRAADGKPAAATEPQPSLRALRALAHSVRHPDLDIDVRVDPVAHDLPFRVQLTAYRIVQESLSNAAKHAGAAHVQVRVSRHDTSLVVDVRDDGAATGIQASGSGLVGMRERAAQCGGSLQAGPLPDGGWQVHAKLPLERLAR